MNILTLEQLATVGGGSTTTTTPDGTTTYRQSNYETCVQAMSAGAKDKYPDNRWFFQRWFHATDENAGARADWLKSAVPTACGKAPPG